MNQRAQELQLARASRPRSAGERHRCKAASPYARCTSAISQARTRRRTSRDTNWHIRERTDPGSGQARVSLL